MWKRNSDRCLVFVDEDEDGMSRSGPAAHFYTVGQRPEHWVYAAAVQHPADGCIHCRGIEQGPKIGDGALADLAGDGCRLVIEPAIALAITHQDAGLWITRAERLGPDVRSGRAPGSGHRNRTLQRVILLDAPAQRSDQRARLTMDIEGIECVLHAGARPQHQMASMLNITE